MGHVKTRNTMLDVLRAAAILLVFFFHLPVAQRLIYFGWVGVDLFFVLSGFLISGLLFSEYQKTGALKPWRFLARRGLKIYPLFYVMIGASVAIGGGNAGRLPIFADLAFIQDYTTGLWEHTWSLGVEEQFYLALVAALFLMARRGGVNPFRRLPWIIVGVGLAVFGLRVATWRASGEITAFTNLFPAHLRVDSLLYGVLLGYAHAFFPGHLAQWVGRVRGWLQPASVVLLAPVFFFGNGHPLMATLGFTLAAWGFVLLLASVLYPAKPAAIGRGTRAMAWLGRVSYAFYLWHAPIICWTEDLLTLPPWAVLLVTFAATCVTAAVTTALIEKPILAWRERRLPSASTRPSIPHGTTARLVPSSHLRNCESILTI